MKKYTAHYEFSRSGHWSVHVEPSRGQIAVSHGRTLEAARRRIRMSLAELLECEEGDFELEDDIALPAPAKRTLDRAKRARQRHRQVAQESEQATRDAAVALSDLGVSRRDAGALLGLSPQRVQQVLGD